MPLFDRFRTLPPEPTVDHSPSARRQPDADIDDELRDAVVRGVGQREPKPQFRGSQDLWNRGDMDAHIAAGRPPESRRPGGIRETNTRRRNARARLRSRRSGRPPIPLSNPPLRFRQSRRERRRMQSAMCASLSTSPSERATVTLSNVLRVSGARAHWDECSLRRRLDALVSPALTLLGEQCAQQPDPRVQCQRAEDGRYGRHEDTEDPHTLRRRH
jgi:hypothetical protein